MTRHRLAVTGETMDAGQATEGLKAIATTGKKHYIWMLVVLVFAILLALKYRVQLGQGIAKMSPGLARWLGITIATAAAVFVVLFGADAAQAATCCAKPVAHAVSGGGFFGWLANTWQTIAAVGAGAGVAL